MLSRQNRLTEEKDITRLLRKGRAVFTNLLVIKALPGETKATRVAVVVGTKVDKRSTQRNLIKRRIRAVLSHIIPNLKVPVDMVITAQNEAVGRKQADLAAALEYCLNKLGLLPHSR